MDGAAAFLVVAAAVVVTPGPDTTLTIRNTLVGGRRSGVFTAIGVVTGQTIWNVATSAGVAALLLSSERLFNAVKLGGAAYLAFLGFQALRAALRRGAARGGVAVGHPAGRHRPAVALRQGLISNLGNPKMAAFFPALLPQFVREGEATFLVPLVLGLTFSLLTLIWLTAYAFAVAKARDLLARPLVRRVLEAATGAVLVTLGVRMATGQR